MNLIKTKHKGPQVGNRARLHATLFAVATLGLFVEPALAQSSHAGHESMTKSTTQQTGQSMAGGMDHSTQATPELVAESDTIAAGAAAPDAMDHGNMQMQGGSAPADARDPHAYSDGYSLGEGKYALSDQRQLRLADEHNFGSVLVDSLEWAHAKDGNSANYGVQAWFGRDYNRVVLKAEGSVTKGKLEDARTELLWGHAIAPFWDTQVGIRQDSGTGPNRTWLAFGVQGLAPYWFDIDATAYAGNNGGTALRLAAEYDLLVTQKLVLQPRTEWNLYGKSDPALALGKGVSDGMFGMRLRYDVSRQLSPYVGVEWSRKFGETATIARSTGARVSERRLTAGVSFWF